MSRKTVAACLLAALPLLPVAATGAEEEPQQAVPVPPAAVPSPPSCPSVRQHERAVNRALRVSAKGGDFRASVSRAALRRASVMRDCARTHFPRRYRAERRAWRERRRVFAFYRRIDRLTPYGAWAIPPAIVGCESYGNPRAGGNWRAANPSGAIGPYQLLGWGAPWPVRTVRDMAMHHVLASRLGLSHWAASRGCWG